MEPQKQTCSHSWQADPANPMFEDCTVCGAIRRVRTICSTCGGRRWNEAVRYDEEGYRHKYRAPCGACDATGLISVEPPQIIQE